MLMVAMPHSTHKDRRSRRPPSRICRLASAAALCGSFAACAWALSGAAGGSRPNGDVAVCPIFRKDLEGKAICEGIESYPFKWANSDCNGILPLVIVQPKTDADVARTVRRTAKLGLPLSVRSGGHSYTCDGIKPGSVHLDLRLRKQKRFYNKDGVWYAEFETGNTFRDLFRIIDRRRFSIVHGACHAVGVGGFYLHGGLHLNSLTALYGWGNESVESMTVVTADGRIRALNASSGDQDLWWAMRRAGSNFGIATSLTVRVFEAPEPQTWLFWVKMSHDEVVNLFLRSMSDLEVQLNLYYVNPPFFQVSLSRPDIFTLQFTLLRGPRDYWQNLRASLNWLGSHGVPLSWWTVAFNAVVPKPDDLTHLGYPAAWVSSQAIWPTGSSCTDNALHLLLDQQSAIVRRAHFHSFRKPGCWLTFSRLPGDQIYYEYNCPSRPAYLQHLRDVETSFEGMCPSSVKYRNTPHWNASAKRYYPDARELLQTKRKWDPLNLLGPALMSVQDLA
ncbi:MnCO [Symbiodinium natans]|uniref:MnCO protein n=1 Tax=Symbiodinium natans TaxID=878477 RepID=A0A812RU40_9DINO|nr:MnCO [Symbiodinium natans]